MQRLSLLLCAILSEVKIVIQQRATRAGFVAVFVFCTLVTPSEAVPKIQRRVADCHVESAGKIEMNGKCLFTRERGGSFGLENVNRDKPLFGEILVLSVTIVSPGIAEVRGLTKQGINSRWGEARRSRSDSACWEDPESNEFKICAR